MPARALRTAEMKNPRNRNADLTGVAHYAPRSPSVVCPRELMLLMLASTRRASM